MTMSRGTSTPTQNYIVAVWGTYNSGTSIANFEVNISKSESRNHLRAQNIPSKNVDAADYMSLRKSGKDI